MAGGSSGWIMNAAKAIIGTCTVWNRLTGLSMSKPCWPIFGARSIPEEIRHEGTSVTCPRRRAGERDAEACLGHRQGAGCRSRRRTLCRNRFHPHQADVVCFYAGEMETGGDAAGSGAVDRGRVGAVPGAALPKRARRLQTSRRVVCGGAGRVGARVGSLGRGSGRYSPARPSGRLVSVTWKEPAVGTV